MKDYNDNFTALINIGDGHVLQVATFIEEGVRKMSLKLHVPIRGITQHTASWIIDSAIAPNAFTIADDVASWQTPMRDLAMELLTILPKHVCTPIFRAAPYCIPTLERIIRVYDRCGILKERYIHYETDLFTAYTHGGIHYLASEAAKADIEVTKQAIFDSREDDDVEDEDLTYKVSKINASIGL